MLRSISTRSLIAAVALSIAASTGVANAAPVTGSAKAVSAVAESARDTNLTDVRWRGRRGYYGGRGYYGRGWGHRGWGPGIGIGLGLGALAAGAAIASGPYYGGCDPYYDYCGPRRRAYYRSYYGPPAYYYAPRRYYGGYYDRPYW